MSLYENAAGLEDLVRWAGIVIAVIGAGAASRDAVIHIDSRTRAQLGRAWEKLVGWLARFFPSLRPAVTIRLSAESALHVSITGEARVLQGWSADATLDQKVEMLDARTRRLDDEIGKLRQALGASEERLRQQTSEGLQGLQDALVRFRGDLESTRTQMVRTDAKALPIVVVGVFLCSVPGVSRWSIWAVIAMLLLAFVITVVLLVGVVRDWRAAKNVITGTRDA